MLKSRTPVVLNGVAGIGKTTLCSYYYKKQQEINPQFFMLYVDLSGCRGLENFTQLVCNAIDIDPLTDLKYVMEYLVEHSDNYQAILFDNWEEFQYTIADTLSWDIIYNYISFLAASDIKILILSQEKILNGWKELSLTELREKEGRRLFEQLLLRQGKKINKRNVKEYQAFEYLLKCMENHPLTMVLTASLVEGEYYDLSRIQNRWSIAYNETGSGNHRSLKTALKMSYEVVANVDGATLLWGMVSKLASDFPVSFIDMLKDIFPNVIWDDAERVLARRCLINNTKNGTLHMLMPIKLQWKNLAESKLQNTCLEKWGALLPTILSVSDAPRHTHDSKKGNPLKREVLLLMDDFMRITKTLIENHMMVQAENCVSMMEPYYELVGKRGKIFLENLPSEQFSRKVQGLIYRCRADIIRLLKEPDSSDNAQKLYQSALSCFEECDSEFAYVKNTIGLNYHWNYKTIEKALKCFEESERLSRKFGYDMCLAEALKNKGVLLANEFGENKQAQLCYEEAKELYKKIGDDRGLAHVIKRMGELEWNEGNIDLAIEDFENALYFYQQVQYIQGIADTISRLCSAYMYKGDEKKLRKMYNDGIYIYDRIPYEVIKRNLKNSMDLAKAKIFG